MSWYLSASRPLLFHTGKGTTMPNGPQGRFRSSIVGDLNLPPSGTTGEGAAQVDPQQRVPMLIELNVLYPGGLVAVSEAFYRLWEDYAEVAGGSWPEELTSASPVQPPVPHGLALIARERGGLSRCAARHQEVGALCDLPLHQRRERPERDPPPIVERRDQRGAAALGVERLAGALHISSVRRFVWDTV